jgi:dipeptidyl aminopeptidase/acylaminoacyl peptidase
MLKFSMSLAIMLMLTRQGFSDSNVQTQTLIPMVESIRTPKHPQEPVPPYPYNEEEVMFVNRNDGVTLAGTLTLPRTQGPFPAVILLHGSAPLDRDCSLFGHKFFLVWADHLTRQGIAVLRFDKRSAGKSTGNYDTATIEDFAADALAGVEYLKSRKEINIKKIGLIGHSEGGMTAPLAASKSEDVAFIVMMAGPCANWEKMMDEQVALIHRANGVAEETIALSRQLLQQMFVVIKKQENRELAAKQLREVLSEHLGRLTIDQRTAFEACYGTIDQQINFFNSMWFRFSLTYDPAATLRKVRIPVLALIGELDANVSSKQNLPLIAKALEEGGSKDYKVMELPKLNHGFQTCQTGSPKEHVTIDETTAPAALNLMSDWILEKTSQIQK